jgi:adenosylmethionine---8-amino-7-oxononanoate aminotransferase
MASVPEQRTVSSLDLERDDKRYLWHPFTQQQEWDADEQLVIDRAEGCFLYDTEGRRYLDGVSSLWVNLHGHNHPDMNRAITEQLGRVAHSTFLGLTHRPAVELARRLLELAPGPLSRVFYSDTGAAAVEIAIKMALQYWQQCDSPRPNKTKYFSLRNAYHGDTVGALSVGGVEMYQRVYRPLVFPTVKAQSAYCYRCHLGKSYPSCQIACLDEVERAIAEHADELAAVIMEPLVQGAAGMLVYPPGYTRAVWEIAKRHDVLFIADEVATAFGRTGKMFACEHEGVEPDFMALGKGISGGYLPLAATLTTEKIYEAFLGPVEQGRTFFHGHTYTGNPLGCAAGLASLDIFERERTLERLPAKIERLRKGLERFRELEAVGDVRQIGLVAGIELVRDRARRESFPSAQRVGMQVIKEARTRGVMLRPLGDVIVLLPPLAISDDEMALLLDVTYDSIDAVARRLGP